MKRLFVVFLLVVSTLAITSCGLINTTSTTALMTTTATSSETTTEPSDLTIRLMAIYTLAVEAEAFTGTYEEWLESVRGPQGEPGIDGKEVTLRVASGYIQWQYVGDATWTNLISLTTLTGANGLDGTDGKEVTFRVDSGNIQWQYIGDSTWTNLVALSLLTGASGSDGIDGLDGKEVSLQVDEGFIQWQYVGDLEWTNLIEIASLVGPSGVDGLDGKEIMLQASEGYIQWQYEGDLTWNNLIELATLVGPAGADGIDGKEVTFRVDTGYIQWQYVGDETWTNLVALTTLTGANGLNGTDGIDGKEVAFRVDSGYIQWQYVGDLTWNNLIELATLVGPAGADGINGVDGKAVTFRVDSGYIQWQYVGDLVWKNLIELATLVGPAGIDGIDGKEVAFRVDSGYIQWQYDGDLTWNNLIELATLVGPAGADGINGIDGKAVTLRVDTGYIQWQYDGDLTWNNLVSLTTLTGADGIDGKEVAFRVDSGYIQWQYNGDLTWNNLIELATLVGPTGADGINGVDGKEVTFRVDTGYIQWQYVGDLTWNNLIELATLVGPQGEQGVGIQSAVVNATGELIITYTDSTVVNLGQLLKVYQVVFKDYNGYVLSVQHVLAGNHASAPSTPTRTGYAFLDWDSVFTDVLADIEVNATYTKLSYSVHFYALDGTLLKTESVPYLDSATAPVAPEVIGKTFTGWSETYTEVKEDLAIHAQYTNNKYLVDFYDYNGSLMSSQSVVYGLDAIAPAAPVRDGYDFAGWNGEYTNVTSAKAIYATYVPKTYTITYYDREYAAITTEIVNHGTDGTPPTPEAVVGYHFVGWDKPVNNVIHDLDVIALYEINTYEVIFRNADGSVFDIQTIEHGQNASDPGTPDKVGWLFVGWNSSLVNVVSNLDIQPLFDQLSFSVGFYDELGNSIDQQVVLYGEDAIDPYPTEPTLLKTGYQFVGWDQPIENIDSDRVCYPVYEILTYQVVFRDDDGTLFDVQTIAHGESAYSPLTPAKTGFDFTGWDTSFTVITEDLTVTATYTIQTFTVNFFDLGMNLLKTEIVPYMSSAVAPTPPTRIGYDFVSWDQLFAEVVGNLDVFPLYQVSTYEVIFYDLNGAILSMQTIEHGSDAVAPSDMTRAGYTFDGWDVSFENVQENLEIHPLYTIHTFTVLFEENGGSVVLDQMDVEYGSLITLEIPTKLGYKFLGWYLGMTEVDAKFYASTPIKENTTLYARWELASYDVTFYDYDNTILRKLIVGHGYSAIAPTNPTRTGYTFTGWDTSFLEVVSDLDIHALYTPIDYLLSIDENGGDALTDFLVPYETLIPEVNVPVKTGYTFLGWFKDETLSVAFVNDGLTETMPLNGLIIYASWQINQYTIFFEENDGSEVLDIVQDYHSAVSEPDEPTRTGYTFRGWYEDIELTVPYEFTIMPAYNQTIYAAWTINEYKLSFYDQDPRYPSVDAVLLLPGETIIQNDAGESHVIVLTSNGRVLTWGLNNYGQLGDGTTTSSHVPIDITSQFVMYPEETITQISSGLSHSAAITSLGRIFTWGYDGYGQLGNDPLIYAQFIPTPGDITSEFQLESGELIVYVNLGGYHSSAITSSGRVFTWGRDDYGQLGNGSPLYVESTPVDITSFFVLYGEETVVSTHLGTSHSAALTSEGRVFTWGLTGFGILSNGLPIMSSTPIDITNQFALGYGEKVSSLHIAASNSSAVTDAGRVFIWGSNSSGKVGDGTTTVRTNPVDVTNQFLLNENETIVSLDFTSNNSTAVSSSGRLFGWGHGYQGFLLGTLELGLSYSTVPIDLTDQFTLPLGETFIRSEYGETVATALTSEGHIWMWGDDALGEIGDGISLANDLPKEPLIYFPFVLNQSLIYDYDSLIVEYIPTLEGRTFVGWYTDINLTQPYVFGTMPAYDFALYGDWTLNQYTVSFDEVGGSVVEDILLEYTAILERPADPTKTGYTFIGWYEDSGYNVEYAFSTMPATDIILYAKWEINQYPIYYDIESDDEITNHLPLFAGEKIIQVSSGMSSTIALTSLGRVFSWGNNYYGQLGDGTTVDRNFPVDITKNFQLDPGDIITLIATTKGYFNAAISAYGRIYTWGYNGTGNLGDGTQTNRSLPVEITAGFSLGTNETIIDISLGSSHSMAITSTGRVFGWGRNEYGQFGNGTTTTAIQLTPLDVTAGFTFASSEQFTKIILGGQHSLGLTSEGRLFSWGRNNQGQIGDGSSTNCLVPIDINYQFSLATDEKVVDIAAGEFYSGAVTSLGRIYMWGDNDEGQLGNGLKTYYGFVPTPIETTEYFTFETGDQLQKIFIGTNHSGTISSKGHVYVWGVNTSDQLGSVANRLLPTDITDHFTLIAGEKVSSLAFGSAHSVSLSSLGHIHTWGSDSFGQLGDGNLVRSTFWSYDITEGFAFTPDEVVVQVISGFYHSSAITSWGRILMWGANASGQLGDGTVVDKETPIDITSQFSLLEGETIEEIILGGGHSFALTSLGRLFVWGDNTYGQLGDGSATNRLTPIEITDNFGLALLETITQVSAGERHSAAITSLGRMFTWGYNNYGQLGDGTTEMSTLPIDITALFGLDTEETLASLQLGKGHSAVLTSAGRLFTFGDNNYGQLGDGTTVDKEFPTDITVQLPLDTGEVIVSVFAGGRNTSVITSLSKVFIWGDNSFYEIGDGTLVAKLTPFEITSFLNLETAENLTTMDIGDTHVIAITSLGRALVWGYNAEGQIGNGTTGYGVSLPLDITAYFDLFDGENISLASLGFSHSLALSSLGEIYSWGYNTDGQLGSGDFTSTTLPVEVNIYYPTLVDRIEVYDYDLAIIPYVLTRVGYTFSGWYLDSDFNTPYVYATMPAEAVYLYAKWTINQYTISFAENGGSEVEDITQDYASVVSAPLDPTRTAYTFIGWYQDIELTIPYVFSTMPAENITVYAKWTNIPYTISFEENGGPEVTDIVAFYNEVVSEPEDPVREGYTFIGWYADSGLTTPYVFTTMPLNGTTVYLKWEINQYTLTYYASEEYLNPQFENGTSHSLLLTADGRLYVVGYNAYGQLGNGTFTNSQTKIDITNLIGLTELETIQKIEAAYHTSFILTSDGRLLGAGINTDGQLGLGDLVNRNLFTDITPNFNLSEGETITDVFTGGLTTFVVTSDNRIFGFGDNYYGSIGDGTSSNDRSLPVDITANFSLLVDETITSIAVGNYHAYALTSDNRVFSWGRNTDGQLGNGTSTNQSLPVDITANFAIESTDSIAMIKAGFHFGLAVSETGRVFSWGYNYYGMLGVNYTGNISWPREITTAFYLDSTDQIVYVHATEYNGQAISASGRVYSWGYGSYYVNGNGSTSNYYAPYEITANFKLFSGELIDEIGGYANSIHAITSDGRIFVWGSGGYGTHFDGLTSSKSTPTNVIITDLVLIEDTIYDYNQSIIYPDDPVRSGFAFGGWYEDSEYVTLFDSVNMPSEDVILYAKWVPNERTITFASNGGSAVTSITKNYQELVSQPANPIREGYTFKGWYEDEGLTISYRFVWMEDRDLTLYAKWEISQYDFLLYDYQDEMVFASVSLGNDHTLALTDTGQLFAWGDNTYGQFGNGSTAGSYVPINITGYLPLATGETIIGIYAGDDLSAVLTSDLRLFTWGYNRSGAVGNGSYADYFSTPQDITAKLLLATGEDIDQVYLNKTSMHVVTTDGRVLGWGNSEMSGANGERRLPYDITPYFNFSSGETLIELEGAGRYIMALTSEDRIFGWGYDGSSGAFGSGDYYYAATPVDFSADFVAILDEGETFIDLEAGYNNMFALTSNNRLIGWGYNQYGELGDGTTIKRDYPIDVTPYLPLSVGEFIDHVSPGGNHVLLKTSDSRMLSWGRNGYYQLGTLTTVDSLAPLDVTANMPIASGDGISQVLGANYSSFILSDSGELIRFGYNYMGLLGDGTTTTRSVPLKLTLVTWKLYDRYRLDYNEVLPAITDPIKYENTFDGWFENTGLTTAFTKTNMPASSLTIYGKWIPNQYTISFETNGGSAIADRTFDYDASISMPGNPTLQGYTFSGWFTDAALTEAFSLTKMPEYNFTLYAKWTINVYNITYYYDNEPIEYTQVSTGGYHTVALTGNGQVFTWGYNPYGQLGDGTTSGKTNPVDITSNFYLSEGEEIIYIYALYTHSVALTSSGRIFAWGYNAQGQVGDGTTTNRLLPVDITANFNFESGEVANQIYKGNQSVYVLTSLNKVFAFGNNGDGVLGIGDANNHLLPVEITSKFNLASLETITFISGGSRHTMAISSTGRVFAWGYNSGTQYVFAQTTPAGSFVPLDITANLNLASGEEVTFIAAGNGRNYALTSLGKLLAWGYGELGDGTTTSQYIPIDLVSYIPLNVGETITKIQSGDSHVLALTSEGRIFTWGTNSAGQLGDGTTTKRLLPVEITNQFTLDTGESLSILFTGFSSNSSFVMTSFGQLYGFGLNHYGLLGDLTTTNRSTPVKINHTAFSYLATSQFDYQEAIVLIANPVKDGYTFAGWYTDPALTQAFTLTNMPSSHIKLYAKWTVA